MVCRGVGLETNTAAADYIARHNGDKKTFAESLAVIQETSAKILNDLFPEQRLPCAVPTCFDGVGQPYGTGAGTAQPDHATWADDFFGPLRRRL